MTDTPSAASNPVTPDAPVSDQPSAASPEVVSADAVVSATGDELAEEVVSGESVTEPAKVMRIGSMVKQLLEEVRAADLDEPSRERLAEVYERSITELAEALSPDLQEELRALSLPFEHDEVPSDAELRVAKAQLVGWLEGLFHGIQASLMAQQFAAQQQLQQMKQLPGDGQQRPQGPASPPQTGTYL